MKKVEVEWLDAQAGFSSPLETKEIVEQEPIHTFSIGYLIHEDKEKIILGFMKWDMDMWKHWQLIPRGMVKKIKELK